MKDDMNTFFTDFILQTVEWSIVLFFICLLELLFLLLL